MAASRRQIIGAWGESVATCTLENLGYEVVARNWSARGGEIDIIAWHTKPHFGRTLCFIEVKTRRANDGSAERATDYKKQQHMLRAATSYCLARGIAQDRTPMQFEHVSVVYSSMHETPTVTCHTLFPS